MSVNTQAIAPLIPVRNAVASLVVSTLGACVVGFNSPQLSAIAYVAVLLLGGLFIYRQRRAAFLASLSARSRLAQRVPWLERVAVIAVLVACVANGVVMALHLSRTGW